MQAALPRAKSTYLFLQGIASNKWQDLKAAELRKVGSPALAAKRRVAEKWEARRQEAHAALQAAEAAARQEMEKHAAALKDSDDLVEAVLKALYKPIKEVCAGRGVKAFVFMENPESTAELGLWNR
jgi:hypothetical protein